MGDYAMCTQEDIQLIPNIPGKSSSTTKIKEKEEFIMFHGL